MVREETTAIDPFAPAMVGRIRVRNRIVRAATHEGLADAEGRPLASLFALYRKLADGGAGCAIKGYAAVRADGCAADRMLMFDTDAAIGWWVRELSAVRASGMPVVLQLVNGGGLSIHPDGLRSSSARKKNAFGVPVAVMTEADIESTVDAFAAAALRAREAGFDGVELHAAHGYLLSEFVSRSLNLRTDAWGGEIAGRGRIVALILSRIRERVADYPVWVKIEAPADDVTRDLSIDAAIAFARELAAAGADAVGVSCGYGNVFQTMRMRSRPSDAVFDSLPSPFGATMKFFATVTLKRPSPIRSYDVESEARIRAAAGVPVLVTGGIRAREDVEAALVKGLDAVTMCRPYVIEPDIASRLRERPSRCVDCGYCLFRVMTRELRCFHGRWD